MNELIFKLFPFPWRFSLIATWLIVTALYILAGLLYQPSRPSSILAVMSLLVPVNFWTILAAYGGFLMLLFKPPPLSALEYIWGVVPPLTLILILSGDWLMHKIGIPNSPVKLLFNLVFLLLLTLLINLALWQVLILPPFAR